MNTSGKKLVISEKNQLAAVYKKITLIDLYIAHSSYQISSIYLGKVDKVVPNIKAAFIQLDKIEKNGFIHVDRFNYRTKSKINLQSLQINKKILVQIVKEPTSGKGPSVTTNVGVVGKYLILLPFGEGINISKKVYNQREKLYLKGLLTLLKPISVGLLIKKEAHKQPEEEILKDLLFVQKKWASIQLRAKLALIPSRLTANIYFIKKVIQRLYDFRTENILIDTHKGAWTIYNILKNIKTPYNNKVIQIFYHKPKFISIMKALHLDLAIYSFLQPKINLVGGGSIIIEKTEALTAIDINTGSFKELQNSRATLLWINCEAAREIVKQLKLRNLGGIIVIDFIDMTYKKDQMILLNHLNGLLKTDWGRPKLIQLSEIGLVELTRKREGQNVYDIFGQKCEHCNGIGHATNLVRLEDIHMFDLMLFETSSIYSNK